MSNRVPQAGNTKEEISSHAVGDATNSKGDWTPGPWCLGPDGGLWSAHGPLRIEDDLANARRIVACVNALEGYSTEWFESDHQYFTTLIADRDHLRERVAELTQALDKATTTLWAALGGNDDPDCKQRADHACKPYRALLAKERP